MRDLLRTLCDRARARGASFADARVYEADFTGITRQDGRADKLDQGSAGGLGVRVLKDHAWGFASASNFRNDSAMEALEAAISMAEASSARSEEAMVAEVEGIEDKVTALFEIDPRSVGVERKMAALQGFEEAATRVIGDNLANSVLSYADRVQREVICNTFGAHIETETVRTRLYSLFVVKDGGLLQRGTKVIGSPGGFEVVERTDAEEFSLKAARLAVSLLTAAPPPAGKFPVIFHPSITGLLTHEAIGHNAEADGVVAGTSIIVGKLGEKIGSELVTIIDDSTIPGAWGSYKYDSECTPSQRRVIIENGVLKGFMHSLETAARLGAAPNGSARAQDYASRPIIRMSNTFIEPGLSTFEDMLKGIDLGLYLKGGQYGHVYSERGQYTCHAGEAYMIRDGELAEHLRDVSVAGLTLDTLMNIDAVADDFEMKMPGMCGKKGQGMYVDNGGPHVRVKELVVGGRA
ncbi:MAG: TldD/PmbA family protein [Armatimonadetes bacterium]|nr:TldD/PmbA family protein [Armatimonadota bacterium]